MRAIAEPVETGSVFVELDDGQRTNRDSNSVPVPPDVNSQKGADQDAYRSLMGDDKNIPLVMAGLNFIKDQ